MQGELIEADTWLCGTRPHLANHIILSDELRQPRPPSPDLSPSSPCPPGNMSQQLTWDHLTTTNHAHGERECVFPVHVVTCVH